MSRKTLNYSQRKEIDLFLGTVLKKFGEGYVEYLNGESDQSVAQRFQCTANNVQGVREAIYGRLRPVVPRSPLEDRVAAIEGYLDDLDPTWRQKKLKLVSSQ